MVYSKDEKGAEQMANWNFPSNGDGQIKGVADAGIENFNGTELSSLAREICQNSLDAAIDDDNPNVIVEFFRHFVSENQIPGLVEYKDVLKKCKLCWEKSKSEKAKKFLENAYRNSRETRGFVLRISDFNTVGLADPYGKEDPYGINFDGWNALIKIDGGANKGDDKAGAFGIGKSAPFCNSHYRLVFYRTLNVAGERAAQGISRLLSFPMDDRNPRQTMTSGIGYYGNPNGNMPIESISELDALMTREKVGTDVFVYGFNGPAMTGEWEKEIITAVLDSFLMSIYKGNLSIKVQNEEINANTLGKYINRYSSSAKNTYYNYQVLTRQEGVYEYSMDFHNLGEVVLKVLVAPEEKLDKKILVIRKAGMKLFRLGNISKLVSFTGILELKGKELNRYFREMENVSHDNWVPGRHSNPKQAKAYYDELKEWIRNIITDIAEYTSDDEINIEGLGGVLQQEPEYAETGDSDNKRENLNDHLGQIDIIPRTVSSTAKGFFYGYGEEGTGNTKKVSGELGKEGNSGVRILKGKRKRKRKDRHFGMPKEEGKDMVIQRESGGETSCPLKKVRVIKKNVGKYTLSFEIPHYAKEGKIELVTVGENGKSNKIKLTDVKLVAGCVEVHMSGETIVFSGMRADEKVLIDVSVAGEYDYAMEVNVYEYN